jgi:hypothetical protein
MRKFKTSDYWISLVLITCGLVYSITRLDDTFLYGYFVVGGWQCVSMIVHAWNGWFTNKGDARRNYHILVVVIIAWTIVGMLYHPVLYIELLAMLFAAPLLALYYTRLCYLEVYVKMQRPLALLK